MNDQPKIIALVLIIVFLLIYIATGHAHSISGDGDWLRHRNTNSGTSCCSPSTDCHRIHITFQTGGYTVREHPDWGVIPFDQWQPSEDQDAWACLSYAGLPRCLFRPVEGV